MSGPWEKYAVAPTSEVRPWEKYAAPVGTEQDSEGKVAGKRVMAAVDQANHEHGKLFEGAGEAALNVLTGLGSSIVGGFRGLSELARGNGMDAAQSAIQDTQHDYTYQPRTGIGKLGSELLTLPVMAAKSAGREIGGDIGQAVGGKHGRIVGESVGDVAPDVAATILGGRAAFKGNVPTAKSTETTLQPMAPSVNYDVPAYVRNGVKAPPEPIPAPAQVAEVTPIAPEVPALPLSSAPTSPMAPVEAYARSAPPDAFPVLNEAVLPDAAPVTALDQFAANPIENKSRPVLNQFDHMLREAPVDPVAKSPLESMIAGEELPAAKITAKLRDTSDIDATLAEFGVGTPAKVIPPPPEPRAIASLPGPVRAIPAEMVERATAPAAPLDAGMIAPEGAPPLSRVPGPYHSAAVERARGAVVPLDDAVRVPVAEETPFVATPEQHVNPANRQRHIEVLRELGLDNKRISAIEGNAAEAAREYQHGKFDEPAGHHWDSQFKAETEALGNYAKKIVDDTKGRTGLDSESLELKGRDIAAPYDTIRKYFEDAKKNLYDVAEQRARENGVPVQTVATDALLADPDFVATLMAKDQQGLLSTIKSQYERFKSLDQNGMSVANAENFRKWLNKVWAPDKSGTLGEVKAALDNDVFKSAGEDVYAHARQMHQLEKATLDDPNGISKLFDSDPRTPINRTTPYEKIPESLSRLSNEQFAHIIETYKALPPELAPVADKAIATLKAHYAERILNAGTETTRGNPRGLWDVGGVRKFVEQNSGKLPLLFDESEMARFSTLLEAGDILRVNPAYPGAAAQAANAAKAGLMTRALGKAGGGIGGAIGAFTGGPVTAGIGAAAGEAAASRLGKFAGERKALAAAKDAIVNEHSQMAPKSAAELFEEEYR